MTTKEFDEKTLKQLIIDLKDVNNYKSFKHGSFIYDLGYYQGNLLVNEIDRLNKEVDKYKLNYSKNEAIDYLTKTIKVDSKDDNCMCLERHEYKKLLNMLLNRELKDSD